MKQTIIFFASLLLAVAIPHSAKAYDFSAVAPTGQTLYYNIVTGGVRVTSQNTIYPYYTTSPTGDLTIPSSVSDGNATYSVIGIDVFAFYFCGLTSVTIPSSVTWIGDYAFYYCAGLTSVTIPSSVTWIGDYAFYYCAGLTSVTIPSSVTFIGQYAFDHVRHIEYYGTATGSPWGAISINGVTYGDFAYADATKQNLLAYMGSGGYVTIPSTVNTIGNNAFFGCMGLTSVTIPNSVTNIGEYSFYACSGLNTVTIPNSVTSIGGYAFAYCSLDSLTIGGGLTTIGDYAFRNDTISYLNYNCLANVPSAITSKDRLSTVIIGNFVTSLNNNAFSNCNALTSVIIGNSVTSIGDNAFSSCTSLSSVTIGNSVTFIGNSAFYGCTGLTSVTIPNSVQSISTYAFRNCTGLTSITIPSSVTNIGSAAFISCTGLTSIVVSSENNNYDSRDNCNGIIETSSNTLVVGCKNTIIPNTVTSISANAFYECASLTSLTIPNSVNSIGIAAFYGCSGISEITSLATTAPQLGNNAFYGVPSNIDVHIPCGSLMSYYSRWPYFSNFVEAAAFTFSATTADATMGSVVVLTQPTCTAPTAVIHAAANDGYRFLRWSNGVTDNPYSLTVTTDTTLTALFTTTVIPHDTVYIYIHDTVYIHDTIYITQEGIDGIDMVNAKVYQHNGNIVVEGADGNTVTLYDVNGRVLATKQDDHSPLRFDTPVSGTYMIKVGTLPARKVVVIK